MAYSQRMSSSRPGARPWLRKLPALGLLRGWVDLGCGGKGATPVVTAEGRIGNSVFTDVNQTARPAAQANPNQPTLIADRVDAKIAAKGRLIRMGIWRMLMQRLALFRRHLMKVKR